MNSPTEWVATALLASAIFGFSTPALAQQRPFTAEDMLTVVQVSGPIAVSPQGDRLAFVLPDLSDEWNVGERNQLGSVHVVEVGSAGAAAPVPVGRPLQRSSLPAFSPDGTRLALHLEGPAGGRLAVYDIRTRELRSVGARYHGSAWMTPRWSGDSRVVYQRPAAPPPLEETPRIRVMESTDALLPGDAFFRNERSAGLAVVDLASGHETAIVADGSPLQRFDVSPGGGHVLVTSGGSTMLVDLSAPAAASAALPSAARPAWLPDGRLQRRRDGRLVAVGPEAIDGQGEVLVRDVGPTLSNPIWAPDVARFATLIADPSIVDPEIETPQPGMYTIARPFMDVLLRSAPEGTAVNVTRAIDDDVGSPVWSPDGRALFFVATDNTTYEETLYRYDVARAELSALSRGKESFGTLIAVPGGIVAEIQSATTPPDLWRIEGATGARTRITDLNPQLGQHAFSEPELFHFDNEDGERLGALIYRPPGRAEGVPVITYVYEKLTPGIHRFQARQQIFATHGYAVLMPNVKVKVGETATSFVKSVVPALADVHAMGFTNGRACLWGGSFGAYATSFVVTQTDVFDCAVSRATPPELFRNWASGRDRDSDNIERGQARMGGSPFEHMERYIAQSAFFHLDRVETPVLITHGVKDYTILHEEGAMMFYALRRLGKVATFVSYREGDHSLYRHSREDALDVHRRMLDWFGKYLRG